MKHIIKYRWVILVVWIVATILLSAIRPDFNAILRQKGDSLLPDNSRSVMANSLLSKMDNAKGNTNILVFYDKNMLSTDEIRQIKNAIKDITDSQKDLCISNIIEPFTNPELSDSLISKDGTTLLISFKLDKGGREISDIQKRFDEKLNQVKAEHYLTGEDFIQNDYFGTAISSVDKSEVLTILFILIVLIIMFRSIITPIVSLAGVAFSYFVSLGIAAQLIDKANFPITILTQLLLLLILFGIGTDYNILLINRFKEELYKGLSVDEAITQTYRSAGKTIAYSVMTVIVAFVSLVFANSPIHQSGVVVVIGGAILLLEILTLTPFLMKTLGVKLFWPSKNTKGHKDSKVWGKISTLSTKYPVISVITIILLIGSSMVFYQQKLNFDMVSELGNSSTSSKAFNIVSEHFGAGQIMPITIVLQNHKNMNNNDDLAIIDNLTSKINKIKGVKQVASVTQPQGKPIENFYINGSMLTVTNGISQTKYGVDQLYSGLKQAQNQFSLTDFSKVSQLSDGTKKLKNGITALSDGMTQIKNGINDGSKSSKSIYNGLEEIETNLNMMISGLATLSQSYNQMQGSFTQIGISYQSTTDALLNIKSTIGQIQHVVNALGSSYAVSKTDSNYQELKQTIDGLSASLEEITPENIGQLNKSYTAIIKGFTTANQNLTQLSSGLVQMSAGLKQLKSGLSHADTGMGTIITNMNNVSDGIVKLESGQNQLASGLSGFSQFGSELASVNHGLKQISEGLDQTNAFLKQFNKNKTFFIPDQAFTNPSFQKVLSTFMTENRTMTKLIVVLDNDPYSVKATSTVKEIDSTVVSVLNGTSLSNAKYGVSGASATTYDMNNILSDDLNQMVIIVLIVIFLILLLVARSFWIPVFITVSLVGAYYMAMLAVNCLFVNILHNSGISSYVPFFAFIIIVALGVDYSIFLIMRYKEYPHLSHKEAIITASRDIGGVVTSAAIILGGTFATLMPSGLVVLVQLSTAVIAGLFILCFILLPIFLPALISFTDSNRQEKAIHKL